MLDKLFILGSAYPGTEKFMDFAKTGLDNILSNINQGGADSGNSSNEVVKFYLTNNPYMTDMPGFFSSISGGLQNFIYNALYWLANISTGLIKGAVWLFTVLPDILLDPNSPLHMLFVFVFGIGIAMMVISIVMFLFHYVTGSQMHNVSKMLQSAMTNIGMMALIPFITFTIGGLLGVVINGGSFQGFTMQQGILGTSGVSGTPSLAAAPLLNNTIDIETWAITGMSAEPYAQSNEKMRNNLSDKDGNYPIPDYTTVVQADDISTINKIVNAKHPGDDKFKDVGNVFQKYLYNEMGNTDSSPAYTLKDVSFKSGVLHVNDEVYKRYRVQNLVVIASYAILIIFSFLMSIKVARAALSSYMNMFGGIIAASRDVQGTDAARSMLMENINSALGVLLDILMLVLFTDLMPIVPAQVQSNFSDPILSGVVYVLVLGVMAVAMFNGSSVIEKSFGITSGSKGQGGALNLMTAPGVMAGALLGGMGAKLGDRFREGKAQKLAGDKPDANKDQGENYTNHGEDAAKELSGAFDDATAPSGGPNSGSIDAEGGADVYDGNASADDGGPGLNDDDGNGLQGNDGSDSTNSSNVDTGSSDNRGASSLDDDSSDTGANGSGGGINSGDDPSGTGDSSVGNNPGMDAAEKLSADDDGSDSDNGALNNYGADAIDDNNQGADNQPSYQNDNLTDNSSDAQPTSSSQRSSQGYSGALARQVQQLQQGQDQVDYNNRLNQARQKVNANHNRRVQRKAQGKTVLQKGQKAYQKLEQNAKFVQHDVESKPKGKNSY
ncbi:MAG: hypothetical protein LBT37_06000 [Lactobacillaceae bacterium]|jgi:hypothetical protein|nr:hypothetical protein [Lactobacillaceae bacterium]